jgi:hypothetical protein
MLRNGKADRHGRLAFTAFIAVVLLTVEGALWVAAGEVSIPAILAEPDKFDQQTVTVRGRARDIYRGQADRATFVSFALTDASGAKLRVWTLGNPEVPSEDEIEVTGVFQKARRRGRAQKTIYNVLEATTIKKATP